MSAFDPISALFGVALIGIASILLALLLGRIAGISGILAACLTSREAETGSRAAFIIGLVAAPVTAQAAGFPVLPPQLPANAVLIAIAGLLVGFGTRLAGGCTSGHGVCGIARMSPRSIVATVIFMVSAMIGVAIMRGGVGG
jgi:uncharacterized protein